MNRSVLARQMFANGGQAVPNEYKGFSKLPEAVQMKMDPVAAKKYQEGGVAGMSLEDYLGDQTAPLAAEARRLGISVEELLALLNQQRARAFSAGETMGAAASKTPVPMPQVSGPPNEAVRRGFEMMPRPGQENIDPGFYPSPTVNLPFVPPRGREPMFREENLPAIPRGDMRNMSREDMLQLLSMPQEPVGMAMGGDPAMAQGVGSMMPPPSAMPPAPPMPTGADMPVEGVDPQQLEGLLANAQQEVEDLDQAEDFETVMNTIRGDEATVEERYEELAGVVGEEDARQTPESVLTLVQPAMVMGAVDQGIGGLAQQEMMEPVQGAMAQGIMSNVAPPPPQPAAPMPPGGMGGPPPVNFKEGGLVRRGDNQPVKMMRAGGDPFAGVEGRLGELARERMAVREGLIGDPSARIQQQEDLTKSQMLFDIANTALAFAAPMEGERPGASAAERLAMAARTTQLPQTIGARAAKLGEFKTGLEKEKQALQLAALGSAETALSAEAKAAEAIKLQELKATQELSKIKLQSKLDLGVKTKVEELAQAGRLDLQNLKGYQNMDLEQLKQAGAISLENYRQANREVQEGVLQQNRIDIEKLKATGRKLDAILANQLKQDNIILRGNIELGRMQVASKLELEKIDKVHDQNTELQNSRLAVQESIASNRLSFDEVQAKLNQARADKELAIKQENLELQQAAEERITVFEQQKIDLEERRVALDEAASQLRDFGDSFDGQIANIILGSGASKLADDYANGKTNEDDTIMLDGILAKYANPDKVWDKTLRTYVQSTGQDLPPRWIEAIKARKEKGLTYPTITGAVEAEAKKDDTKVEAAPTGNDLKDITYESILSQLDAAKGTGAPAAISKAINTGFKAVLPFLGKPFKEGSRAAALIKNINTQATVVYMTDVAGKTSEELRRQIEDTLPKPEQWFSTDEDAINAIENTIAAFNGRIKSIDTQINNPVRETDIGKLEAQKQSLLTIRDAYAGLGANYQQDAKDTKKGGKRPITDFIGGVSDDDED